MGGGEWCQAAALPHRAKLKKNTDFVGTMISKILSDLNFSANQPLN